MRVAKEWRLTPSQWDDLEPDDKAEMMALVDAEGKMIAVEKNPPSG